MNLFTKTKEVFILLAVKIVTVYRSGNASSAEKCLLESRGLNYVPQNARPKIDHKHSRSAYVAEKNLGRLKDCPENIAPLHARSMLNQPEQNENLCRPQRQEVLRERSHTPFRLDESSESRNARNVEQKERQKVLTLITRAHLMCDGYAGHAMFDGI